MSSVILTMLVDNAPVAAEVTTALQELTVTTTLDGAGSFRLRLGIAPGSGGDWPLLAEDLFPPQASVRIGIAVDSPLPAFLLVGYVASQSVVYGDRDGQSSVEIGGVDATALMNLEEKAVAWPNLPDSAIAAQIFAQHKLVPQVSATTPVLLEPEGITLQRGSDIRFLRRLAQRNGFEVFVLPHPQTGIEAGHFEKVAAEGSPAAVLAVRAGDATSVTGLRVSHDMLRPTTVVADALDQRHSRQNASVGSPSSTLGRTSALSRLSPAPVVRLTGTGLTSSGALEAAAQAVVDRASRALTLTGTVGARVGPLRPADVVHIGGAGAAHSGPWLIRAVTHAITPGSYVQTFTAARNAVGADGRFGAVPA